MQEFFIFILLTMNEVAQTMAPPTSSTDVAVRSEEQGGERRFFHCCDAREVSLNEKGPPKRP